MIPLNEAQRVQKATNCTGPMEWFQEQRFMVQESDIGVTWKHYLGYNHKAYKFTPSDVGRTLIRTAQGQYRCWWFSDVK